MVKPAALPMPWIGGGGRTGDVPSSTVGERRRQAVEEGEQVLAFRAGSSP